jgi:hypothetical protein
LPLLDSLNVWDVVRGESGTEPLVLGAVPLKSELIREVQCCYSCNVFRVVTEQWRVVVEAVRDANVIVIVGYGFPPEDVYGRFLLEEGARQRRKRLKRIEYYNIGNDSEPTIRKIFGAHVKIAYKGPVLPGGRLTRSGRVWRGC